MVNRSRFKEPYKRARILAALRLVVNLHKQKIKMYFIIPWFAKAGIVDGCKSFRQFK